MILAAQNQVLLVQTPLGLYLYRQETMDLIGFLDHIESFMLSPDEKLVYTTYTGIGLVKIWNVTNGDLIHTIEYEATPPKYPPEGFSLGEFLSVRALAFSSDEKMLAVSYGDDKIIIWQTGDWEKYLVLTSPIAPKAYQIVFSHNDELLATEGGNTVGIWRLKDAKLLLHLPNHQISAAPFSIDENMIVTSYYFGVVVWGIPGFEQLHTYTRNYGGSVPDVSFSSDTKYLIVDHAQVWYMTDGTRLTPDKEKSVLLSDDSNSTLPVMPETATYEAILEQKGHLKGIQGIALDLDKTILLWGVNGSDLFWQNLIGESIKKIDLGGIPLNTAAYSSKNKSLAICTPNQLIFLSVLDGITHSFAKCGRTGYLTFLPNGNTLAQASSLLVNLINITSGIAEHSLRAHTNEVTAMAVSQDGALLASGTSVRRTVGSELFIWRMDPLAILKKIIVTSNNSGFIQSIAFSPNSELIAVGGADQYVKLYRVSDGWQLKNLGVNYTALSLTFSPDGRLLVAGDASGEIFIWSIPDGIKISTLTGHQGAVVDVDFSPDGTGILTTSQDGTIRLWGVP